VEPKTDGAVFDGIRSVKQASWETLDALKSMAEGIRNETVICESSIDSNYGKTLISLSQGTIHTQTPKCWNW